MVHRIQAKTILSRLKAAPDPYFGITYSMNLYRGCQHACIYCDSRSKVYQLGDLSDIRIKENAIDLLHQELKVKRRKGTIGTGSMNDPYMPVEAEEMLTRGALSVIRDHRYPVHVMTKSDLVTRDVDLLQDLSRNYAAVSFTITTPYDTVSQKIEPMAVPSSKRFAAMEFLAQKGLYTGVILTPVLPFITNKPEAISELVKTAAGCGAQYVIGWMGMTLREGQREYYYAQLEKSFPGIQKMYQQRYALEYSCTVPNAAECREAYYSGCAQIGLPTKMHFYQENDPKQLSLFENF